MYKTDNIVKPILRESFPYKMPLRDGRLLKIVEFGSLFVCVHCDIEVPESLREAFANFPPTFKNIDVGWDDIGLIMKEHAEKKGHLTQPRSMLKLSYFFENGTTVTLLLLIYLDLGLVCRKNCRHVQYTPMKCFNIFVLYAVNAWTVGD